MAAALGGFELLVRRRCIRGSMGSCDRSSTRLRKVGLVSSFHEKPYNN